MRFSPFLALLFAFFAFCNSSFAQTSSAQVSVVRANFTLHCAPEDSASLAEWLTEGVAAVEQFFGHPFPKKFDVYVFSNRAALDKQWQQDWGDSTFQSACWMVASGVGHRLDVLSPRAWATEACDHNASDTLAVRKLLQHELVHVYHGQHNAKTDFAGMDELGWWIEGVAVYASGQLDDARLAKVRDLIARRAYPAHLQEFWSGKNKYGLAGSMAAWIDKSSGRTVLFNLLSCANTEQVLKTLQTDEVALLVAWEKYWSENH